MRKAFFLFIAVLLIDTVQAQNVGIGTPAPQAALDVNSTTQGFLPPRMTVAQRDAIVNPVAGLVIYCIDCDEMEMYNGTIWKNMAGNAACVIPEPASVTICNQVWMMKNLDVVTYRNGDTIPRITTWPPPIGGWTWVNDDSAAYAATYGRLYNWSAVNDPRGLAPVGWHIATDSEWTVLANCLGGDTVAGGKMKETGVAHWGIPNTGATNSSGFTGRPAGYRKSDGAYDKVTVIGFWWTATSWDASNALFHNLNYNNINLGGSFVRKISCLSVRCVRDY